MKPAMSSLCSKLITEIYSQSAEANNFTLYLPFTPADAPFHSLPFKFPQPSHWTTCELKFYQGTVQSTKLVHASDNNNYKNALFIS